MASKWKKVDIYDKKLDFSTMTIAEVRQNAERLNFPNKVRFTHKLTKEPIH
jgi:hypothetical protein